MFKIPAFCPTCDQFIDTVKYFWDWGVCDLCFIEYIENNEEKFKNSQGEVLKSAEMRELIKKIQQARINHLPQN